MRIVFLLVVVGLLSPTRAIDARFDDEGSDEKVVTCRGCVAETPKGQVMSPGIAVPYRFKGKGRAGVQFDKGECKAPDKPKENEACLSKACSLLGELTIENTSPKGGRDIFVRESRTGKKTTTVPPGGTYTITFGDPAAQTAEALACGKEQSVEVSSVGLDQSGKEVPVAREFLWNCTGCGVIKPAKNAAKATLTQDG